MTEQNAGQGEVLTGAALEEQMKKEAEAKAAAEKNDKPAPKNPQLNIVRGRMPLAVVAMARFGDTAKKAAADSAKEMGTTIGKIDDIRKNRNFSYITKDFIPTQAQIDEGIAYFQKHPDYSSGACDPMINELEKMTPATAEQAAAFETLRKASHGQPSTDAKGQTIPAGGGNNRSKKKEKAPAAPKPEGTAAPVAKAEDLLK